MTALPHSRGEGSGSGLTETGPGSPGHGPLAGPGTLATSENVEHYASIGTRCFMTGINPWIEAGAKDFQARAAAGAKK